MKNNYQDKKRKFANLWNPAVKVHLPLWFGLLGGGGIVIGILGIRDVALTPLIISLTGNQQIRSWLLYLYLGLLLLSVLMILLYFINRPCQISPKELWLYTTFLLLAGPFFYLLVKERLILDFWLDELMSIVRHIQPSVRESILSYPVPNNHVFSNFLSAIYIQVIGREEMSEILRSPVILRLPYLIFGILSILVVGYTAKTSINELAGYIAVILLSTTIPFLNFMVQVRGYSLSFLLSSLVFLNLLKYMEKPTGIRSSAVLIFSCLLLYTIPSNIYFIASLMLYFVILGLAKGIRSWKNQASLGEVIKDLLVDLIPLYLMAGGILLAILFYSPLLAKMTGNSYVQSRGFFNGTVFQKVFKNTFIHLVSNRWIVFVPGLVGLGLFLVGKNKGSARNSLAGLALVSIFTPFLLSFIRGDQPFERVFLVILPVLLLFITLGLVEFYEFIKKHLPAGNYLPWVFITVVFLVSNVVFFSTYRDIKAGILHNLVEQEFNYVEFSDNRMWASHFLEYYQVMDLVEDVRGTSYPADVIIDVSNTRYSWVVSTYLDVFGIEFSEIEHPSEITASEILVVLSYANRSLDKLQETFPGAYCSQVSNKPSLYQIWQCNLGL